MTYTKLLLAVAGATMLLGALCASASARNLSNSTNTIGATWARMDIGGGFGTVECEVTLGGTVPSTIAKTVGGGAGSITAANVNRCSRGGATILGETLPWSIPYRSFAGTLPNIVAMADTVVGFSFRIREPSFGVTCLARSTGESPATLTFNRETDTGRIPFVDAGGSIPCRGAIDVTDTIGGRSSSASARTVTLI